MSDRYWLELASFEEDVERHQMTVLRDEGVNRHLRFRAPGTGNLAFDLVTWPDHLCYTGDAGTFVFSRLEDMFQFFRHPDADRRIDMGYWAEKCLAADRDGIKQYSKERFESAVMGRVNDHIQDENLDELEAAALRICIADDVLRHNESEYDAHRAASDFEYKGFALTDFYETDLTEFTVRFQWCCYALAWAIRQYDAAKQDVAA
jgi:hypothetical protein